MSNQHQISPSRLSIELICAGLLVLLAVAGLLVVRAGRTGVSDETMKNVARLARPASTCGPIYDRRGVPLVWPEEKPKRRGFAPEIGNTGTLVGADVVVGGLIYQQRTCDVVEGGRWDRFLGDPIWSAGPAPAVRATVDLELCQSLGQILEGTGMPGCIIVVDQHGDVRGYVQEPSLRLASGEGDRGDPQVHGTASQPVGPAYPAWQWEIPPGSSLKPFIAGVALEEGVSLPSAVCTGVVHRWGRPLRDWGCHGQVGLDRALALSCDTYFYLSSADARLTGKALATYADLCGLSQPTMRYIRPARSDLAALTSAPADTERRALAFIGQSITCSPFALLSAYAALLWDRVPTWRFIDRIGKADLPPELRKSPFTEPVRNAVRGALNGAVRYGTARPLRSVRVPVAAKTGTAETGGNRRISWCVAEFGESPEHRYLVVTVLFAGERRRPSAVQVAPAAVAAVLREERTSRG